MGLFDRFSRKGMDEYVAEAAQVGATIVDVREADEYASGHIEGALSIPLSTLADGAAQMLPDKDALLYVHCLSGGRSDRACKELKAMGYTNAVNIGGVKGYHGPLV